MSFFFPIINTSKRNVSGDAGIIAEAELYDLDQLFRIQRQGVQIYGYYISDLERQKLLIADCQSENGAIYLMECIQNREQPKRHDFLRRDR